MFKEMPMKMLSFYVLFKLKSKRFLFLMTSIFIMWLSCNIINSRIPKQKISPSIHVQCAGNKDEGYKMMMKTFFFFSQCLQFPWTSTVQAIMLCLPWHHCHKSQWLFSSEHNHSWWECTKTWCRKHVLTSYHMLVVDKSELCNWSDLHVAWLMCWQHNPSYRLGMYLKI